jgi:hypothetical protein
MGIKITKGTIELNAPVYALRKVPTYWKHPKDAEGNYTPLRPAKDFSKEELDMDLLLYGDLSTAWKEGFALRFNKNAGTITYRHLTPEEKDNRNLSFVNEYGPRPSKNDYVPASKPGEPSVLVFYKVLYDDKHGYGRYKEIPDSPEYASLEELKEIVTHEFNANGKVHVRHPESPTGRVWLDLQCDLQDYLYALTREYEES